MELKLILVFWLCQRSGFGWLPSLNSYPLLVDIIFAPLCKQIM